MRKVLSVAHALVVDREAICWFLDSPPGRIMRGDPAAIQRELPINYPALPERAEGEMLSADPLDRVMVRGRVDVLILNQRARFKIPLSRKEKSGHGKSSPPDENADSAILLDYKTDAISEIEVPTRADTYRPQLQAYSEALQRITGITIRDVYLVFLSPRINWRLTIGEMPSGTPALDSP